MPEAQQKSKFQQWLEDEIGTNTASTLPPIVFEEEDEEEAETLVAATPTLPEPKEMIICSPVQEGDPGDACLRLYHDGECGEWCKSPPWPLRSCLPRSSSLSPVRIEESTNGTGDRGKAEAMDNLRATRQKKVARRKILLTLYELCAPDAQTGVKIDDFAEYLTFVDPSVVIDMDIIHTMLKKVRLDVDTQNVDFDTFEAFFAQIEPILPPEFLQQLYTEV